MLKPTIPRGILFAPITDNYSRIKHELTVGFYSYKNKANALSSA